MTIFLIIGIFIFLILVWLTLEFSILIPSPKGIPILMYHKISERTADGLSVPEVVLEKHLQFLKSNLYRTISFSELETFIQKGDPFPEQSVMLTFDDAYQNFAERALPLLKKYNFQATVFIPVGFIGKTNDWDQGKDSIMTAETIRKIAQEGNIEFGIHSFLHKDYSRLTTEEISTDLAECFRVLRSFDIPFTPVLAYPYGAFPKSDKLLNTRMKQVFRDRGLKFALRIGNRINPWPLSDPYEIKRIDIRGTDTMVTFRIKLRKGRKKLFS